MSFFIMRFSLNENKVLCLNGEWIEKNNVEIEHLKMFKTIQLANQTINFFKKTFHNINKSNIKVFNRKSFYDLTQTDYSFEIAKNYLRINEKFSFDEFKELINKPELNEFQSLKFKTQNRRYVNFLNTGIVCKFCGLKGEYFCLENNSGSTNAWHFNLYGLNENDQEVMLTLDHIIPLSKGGEDELSNFQTLCTHCNSKKGNNI